MARNIFSIYESSIQLKLSILFVGKVKITPLNGSIFWLQAILCGTTDIKSDAINSLTWDVLNVRQIMHGEKYLVVPGTCNLLPIKHLIRDQEIPTAAFHCRYSELAVGYPVFQKRLWLVFQSFPQSDCNTGNRRMHFIPCKRGTKLYTWCTTLL